MNTLYQNIRTSVEQKEQLLAVLIDPDKMMRNRVSGFIDKVNTSIATHIFVGGSEVDDAVTEALVLEIKKWTMLPVILFPGDVTQITEAADGLLFLSLISGRNPDYLIDKHVKAASVLQNSSLEVIPTGYILIENLPAGRQGVKETAVQRVTNTRPMPRQDINSVVDTAFAGQLMGQQLIYLEAGSGATSPVAIEMISQVKQTISIPLIVGGGIRTKKQLHDAYNAGADLVVIGTAFEDDETFFEQLKKKST